MKKQKLTADEKRAKEHLKNSLTVLMIKENPKMTKLKLMSFFDYVEKEHKIKYSVKEKGIMLSRCKDYVKEVAK